MSHAPIAAIAEVEHLGKLVNNYRLSECLREAFSSGTHAFTMVPDLIERVIDQGAWRDRMTRGGARYRYAGDEDFLRYITEPHPQGLGLTVKEVEKYLGDSGNTARTKFDELIAKGPGNPTGTNQHTRKNSGIPNTVRDSSASSASPPIIRLHDTPEEQEQPEPKRDRSREPHAGNSIGYAVRRIGAAAEDDPDQYRAIYDRLMAGAISAHAAMLEAGFIKPKFECPCDPAGAAQRIAKHIRGDDLATLARLLSDRVALEATEGR